MDIDWEKFGEKLRGAGAGFSGQGPQYQRQKALADEAEFKRRSEAARQDTRKALLSLQAGNTGEAASLMQDRLQALVDMGVEDTTHTATAARLLTEGRHDEAEKLLKQWDDREVALGNLSSMAPANKMTSKVDTDRGVTWNTVDGVTTSTPIEGWTPKPKEPEKPKDLQPQINTLRKDVNAVTKDYYNVERASEKLRSSLLKGTAAGDMAAIFNFMKINDPASTVREGEYASAQNAAGVPDRVRNAYNNALSGQLLSPGQRKEFASVGRSMIENERKVADKRINNILQQGETDGIAGERIMGAKRFADYQKRWSSYDTQPRYLAVQGDNLIEVTESDILETAKKHGKTPEQVMQDLGIEAR